MPYRAQQTRLYRAVLFLSFFLFIANCATIHKDGDLPLVENEQQAVFALVAQKEDAIRHGDMNRFLSLLNRKMPEYVIEQQHWLQYYQNADVAQLRLEPVDIAKRDANTYIVTTLSRFPQTDEGFEYQKHNTLYTRQLHEAIEATLGVDSGTFNDRWLAWIKKQNRP